MPKLLTTDAKFNDSKRRHVKQIKNYTVNTKKFKTHDTLVKYDLLELYHDKLNELGIEIQYSNSLVNKQDNNVLLDENEDDDIRTKYENLKQLYIRLNDLYLKEQKYECRYITKDMSNECLYNKIDDLRNSIRKDECIDDSTKIKYRRLLKKVFESIDNENVINMINTNVDKFIFQIHTYMKNKDYKENLLKPINCLLRNDIIVFNKDVETKIFNKFSSISEDLRYTRIINKKQHDIIDFNDITKQIENKYGKYSIEYLFIRFFFHIGGRNELSNIKVIYKKDDADKDNNYLLINNKDNEMIYHLRSYKTASVYKDETNKLNDELRDIIENIEIDNYLFPRNAYGFIKNMLNGINIYPHDDLSSGVGYLRYSIQSTYHNDETVNYKLKHSKTCGAIDYVFRVTSYDEYISRNNQNTPKKRTVTEEQKQAYKDRKNEKIDCVLCGKSISRCNMTKHVKVCMKSRVTITEVDD